VTDLRDRAKWGPIGGQPPFLPVVDGTVMTDPPLASLNRHARAALPLLIGSTDDEARLYLVPGGAIDRIPAAALAGAIRGAGLPEGAPVWNYHFAWQSPGFGGRLGAGHVVDVPYVFNTLASTQAGPFLGGAGHQPLADRMFGHWLRFVKTGDPGWPRHELTTRPTMRFDTTSAVVADPLADRRQLWSGIAFK
jgi:para-nitrobenzyl esterase